MLVITALIWIASKLAQRRAARRTEIHLGRAVLAWKRERYIMNPELATRQRIPKISRSS